VRCSVARQGLLALLLEARASEALPSEDCLAKPSGPGRNSEPDPRGDKRGDVTLVSITDLADHRLDSGLFRKGPGKAVSLYGQRADALA